MLAGVLHGSRDVRIREWPRPAAAAGQVRLRVRRAGICGSDIHYYLHGYCGRFVPTRPFVLGHEFVATIEAVGEGVDDSLVGQRVIVNPAASCGHCEYCRSGRGNLCPTVTMLGSASTTPPTDGGFAEYVVAPASQCYTVPESLSDADAAMMEPLSVALHAIHRAGDVAGKRVLISGGGPIGLLTARAARALGASQVVISEPNEIRRKLAAKLAADDVLDPAASNYSQHGIAISDGGFDVVFEASGATAAVRGAMDLVRRGGAIVQIGTVGTNDVTLPVNDLMVREISLLGTFRYADEFPQAIRLAVSGRIVFDGLVTAVLPLGDLPAAFKTACNADSIKVHLTAEG